MTRSLLQHAAELANDTNAAAVFVYADALPREDWEPPDGLRTRLLLVTRTVEETQELEGQGHKVIRVPAVNMTRLGQVKMAVLLALSRDLLKPGDAIICLAGAAPGTLDMLLVTEVGREYEMFLAPSGGEASSYSAPSWRRRTRISFSNGSM